MNKSLIGLLAALVAIAAIVAGCGSSGSDTGSTESESESSITKAQFVKKGNAVCKAGSEEINAKFEEFGKESGLKQGQKPSEAQLEEIAETIIAPQVRQELEELRALGTPEGDEGEVEELLANVEAAVEEVEEEPAVLEKSESAGPFGPVNKEAREYGLTVCGEEEEEG